MLMALKKMTTYMDEDLLRSVKALAANRGGKIYEVLDEALRRYLEETGTPQASTQAPAETPRARELSLVEALSVQEHRRMPGVPREGAVKLEEGDTLSEMVIAERESRGY